MEQDREAGVSRRRVLKRLGAGVAVAWAAPVLTSLRSAAFAQVGSPQCPCDLNEGCDPAIGCEGSDETGPCNCWTLADQSACWCGPLVLCDTLQPCDNGQCPPGFACVWNCCGFLCYPECPLEAGPKRRGPRPSGREYGTL